MDFRRGDHICAVYSATPELAREVAEFLADGLRSRQRCWYVGSGTNWTWSALDCGSWASTWRPKRHAER